jgi:N-acetylmuramoyl-L-alanine amidase
MTLNMRSKYFLYTLLTVLFLAILPVNNYADNEEYIISEERIYPIEIQNINGIQYISLQRVADILNSRLIFDEGKNSYTYKFENRLAILAPGKSLISVEGRLEFISQKTIPDDDDILVPVEFLTKIIPLIHKQPMLYNTASRAYVLGDAADPFNLQVNMLPKPAYLRMIIQAKNSVPFKVSRDNKEVTVLFSKKIILLPFEEKKFTEDIIESVTFNQLKDSTEMQINLRFEPRDIKSYQFKEPFRLVIDFMREAATQDAESPTGTEPARAEDYSGAPSWLESNDVKTIVIDPGHGGDNEGAIGSDGLKEKDVTLQIAQNLKGIIEQNIAGVKVVLSRTSDIDVSIQARTEIANHNKADLFVSIHCNGSVNRNARGAEVFILSGEASDDATRIVAELENQADESTVQSSASARVPHSPLTPILWELAQNEYLRESALLAEQMQAELNQLLDTPERGVKQAPFKILTGAIMPAVLVEVAFITNPKEENDLRNEVYQAAIAKAIYRSILRFQSLREQKSTTGFNTNDEDQ